MAKNPRYGGSPVASQAPAHKVPYSPDIQPDISSKREMRGVKPSGFPPTGAFTLSAFDARPPQTIDAEKHFRTVSGERVFLDGTTEVISTALAQFVIPVPAARTFLLKEIEFSVVFPNDAGETEDIVTSFGFPSDRLITANPRVSLLVNGAPVNEWGDLSIPDNLFGSVGMSCYVLVPGGQELTFQFALRVEGTSTDNFQVYGALYGNYILSKGTSLQVEPVNSEAIPIREGYFGTGVDPKGSLGIRGKNE